ncbi:MAG TPA: tRNA-dihydrouridine synthase family protein [Desulfonatronum sp.]|nr:tRNA-dihydrouridine synthase family protein [Desulfonatronum sp.]
MDAGLPIHPGSPWLAPLAGFSDLPFRLLCREQGCAVACTEMISAKGLTHCNQSTQRLLLTHLTDQPLVVQLYGSEADSFVRPMEFLLERGFRFFDLNAGCSVPKVARTGSGAALLRTPEKLLQIAEVMVQAAGAGNVGVKLRLGWDKGERTFLDLGRPLEDLGVGWLTLHPRWAVQGFSGQALWDGLRALRERVAVPVIASGDLFSAEDGCRCLDATGVNGVMFARGALWDPAIFNKYLSLFGLSRPDVFSPHHCLAVARRHMVLCREHLSDRRALLAMRTVVPRYLRHFHGAKSLRQSLTALSSWWELEDVLDTLSKCANAEKQNPACLERTAHAPGEHCDKDWR